MKCFVRAEADAGEDHRKFFIQNWEESKFGGIIHFMVIVFLYFNLFTGERDRHNHGLVYIMHIGSDGIKGQIVTWVRPDSNPEFCHNLSAEPFVLSKIVDYLNTITANAVDNDIGESPELLCPRQGSSECHSICTDSQSISPLT